MDDPYDLARFVAAQEPVYAQALGELRRGRKQSHWMWFVFPQLAGLGLSATSRHFAIRSLDEARFYLDHPLLGSRLRQCTDAVLVHAGKQAERIFGGIDAAKFRSSMTLFAAASDAEARFTAALQAFFAGEHDPATLRLLG
jgi:uncharacterized protein (DUF1810 family)